MGVRRFPASPFPPPEGGLVEASLHLVSIGHPGHPGSDESEFPAIDVFETPGELVLEAELPGVDPASIGVAVREGLIVIEGVKGEEPLPGRVNHLCMERVFGAYRRIVPVDAAVDMARARATYRNGLLQVRVPKVDEKRGRIRVIPVAPQDGEEEGRQ